MSKILWGGLGAVVVIVATGVGAKIYADNSLAAYYQQSTIAKNNYSLSYANYQMGAMSGGADVKFVLQRDPCDQATKMTFVGQDKISRSWRGYEIQSTLQLQNKQDKYAKFLSKPILAHTVIQWTGQVKTKVSLPQVETDIGKLKLQLAPSFIDIQSQVKDHAAHIKEMQLNIPDVRLFDQKDQFHVQNSVFKTNQGLNQTALEAGYAEWQTEQIRISIANSESSPILVKALEMKSDSVVNKNTADIKSVFKIGQIITARDSNYKNAEFHLDFKELNRAQLEQYFKLIAQKDSSCAAAQSFANDVTQALLSVFNAGFIFESKNNQLQTNAGSLAANLSAKIMPNYVTSVESMAKMLPSLVDAKMDLSIDKKLLMDFLKLRPSQTGQALNEQQVEQTLKSLEDKGQIKREGQRIKVGMTYVYGQPNFESFK